MSFLHDAIMESNELEEMEIFQKMKSSPQLKGRKDGCDNSEEIQEGIVTDTIDKVGDVADKVSQVCDVLTGEDETEDVSLKEELVDIEEYLPETAYIEESMKPQINENVTELPDRYAKGRPGSPEYDANDRRRAREAEYRKLINVGSDFEITEDNIKDWALNRVCSDFRCDPVKLKAELLKQPYTGLEKYSED